jgi:hypothetical protein
MKGHPENCLKETALFAPWRICFTIEGARDFLRRANREVIVAPPQHRCLTLHLPRLDEPATRAIEVRTPVLQFDLIEKMDVCRCESQARVVPSWPSEK